MKTYQMFVELLEGFGMLVNDKISVIIPVFNLEDCIKRTLDSVCAQTYSNLEIIVIDDGSTDKSYQVICDYAKNDPRIISIHQENAGVTSARLNGLEHATGEWIGFVDGDDEIDTDMYEILIHNALKYNAQISHCGYRMIFEDGRVNYFHNTNCIVEQDNLKGLSDLLDGSLVEPGLCNKLYHKALIQSFISDNAMDKGIKNNEDLLMNYFLFSKSEKSVFVDQCKYRYIVRRGSASRRISTHTIYDPIKVKKIICDISPNEIKAQAQRSYLTTCINVFGCLMVCDADKKDVKTVLGIIIEQKDCMHLLKRKQKILMWLIIFSPSIYKILFKAYSKYFQTKKYD